MRHRAIIVASVGWLVVALGLSACEEKVRPSVLTEIDSETLPRQESWNSTVVVADSGKVKAIIRAGYIRVYDQPRHTLLSQGVNVTFFDEYGKETSWLTSDEGKVDDVTNNLEAFGNVNVVSSDSTKLRTARLFWDNQRHLIHTPEYVWITGTDERIQGRGFEADQNLRNYRIFHVSGEAKAE